LYNRWLLVNSYLYISRFGLPDKGCHVTHSQARARHPLLFLTLSLFLFLSPKPSLCPSHTHTHAHTNKTFFGITAVIVDVINVFLSASFWAYYEFIGVNFHPSTLHVPSGILIELLRMVCWLLLLLLLLFTLLMLLLLVFITVPFRTASRFFN